jgi:hypothetical protein
VSVYFGFLPASASACWAAVCLFVGTFLGWFVAPSSWAISGPFRLAGIALGQATRESGFSTTAAGDDGRSIGVLQYFDETTDGDPLPSFDRTSPFWSGWYYAQYVGAGLSQDLRWLLLALPLPISWPLWHWSHTHGVSKTSISKFLADPKAAISECWNEVDDDGRNRRLRGFLFYRLVSLALAALTFQALAAAGLVRFSLSRRKS